VPNPMTDTASQLPATRMEKAARQLILNTRVVRSLTRHDRLCQSSCVTMTVACTGCLPAPYFSSQAA
jgi:hypothetical protein